MEPFLTLYLCVHKGDVAGIKSMGFVPFRYTGTHWKNGYIGLRENKEDAFERGREKLGMEKSELVTLKVEFSKEGYLKYTFNKGGEDRRFAHVLDYQVYYKCKENKDWGAWHFNAELPLKVGTDDEGWLIRCTFEESGGDSAEMGAP